MSNDFPSVPTGFELASVFYTMNSGELNWSGAHFSLSGIFNQGVNVTVQFNTPGTFTGFDQSTFEADIDTALTAICQTQADQTGQTLAEVQAEVAIDRVWTWQNSSDATLTWFDTSMAYPA